MKLSQNHRTLIVTILAIGFVVACVGSIYSNIQGTKYTNSLVDISQQGVVITSIKANELVKLPITIEGYLDGTGWTSRDGVVGSFEISDTNGNSVIGNVNGNMSTPISITSDPNKYPVYFKASLGDRQMVNYLVTRTGVIKIISNVAKEGDKPKSISIPVIFMTKPYYLVYSLTKWAEKVGLKSRGDY